MTNQPTNHCGNGESESEGYILTSGPSSLSSMEGVAWVGHFRCGSCQRHWDMLMALRFISYT